jgi:ABC-type multidrug transport system ATPase subunit
MTTAPILTFENVTTRYGRRTVLDRVSFAVQPGQIVALLGGNGAGKTTTLKCILGVTPFEGTITVGGIRVDGRSREARRLVGYVPQLPALAEDDTCEQALAFIAELRRVPAAAVSDALERVNLLEQRNDRVGELSGGMRQRLALAAALLGDPQLLLLDEPTASLDVDSRTQVDEIIRTLRSEGRTIVLSTHHHAALDRLADHVLVLRDAAVAFDGRTDELMRRLALNRWVVNLNGHTPAQLVQALARGGIDPTGFERAPVLWDGVAWEHVLAAVSAGEVER